MKTLRSGERIVTADIGVVCIGKHHVRRQQKVSWKTAAGRPASRVHHKSSGEFAADAQQTLLSSLLNLVRCIHLFMLDRQWCNNAGEAAPEQDA
jgi:hypothetical protein